MSFRVRDALKEALENLAASSVLSAITAGAATLAFSAILISTGVTGNAVQQRYDDAVFAGAFAYLVGDRHTNSIPVAACEEMNAIDGVLAAGAQVRSSESSVNGAAIPLRLVRMTQGAVRGGWPDVDLSGGVIAGSEAARRLGFVPGAELTLGDGTGASTIVVSAVAGGASRVSGINDAVVVVAQPVGEARECIVWADPGRDHLVAATISGWFGSTTLLSPYIPDATARSQALEAAGSFTRNSTWAFAAVAVNGLLLIVWFIRRQEAALYRILGASEKSIVSGYCLDTAVLAFLPLQLSVLIALAVAPPSSLFVLTAVVTDWVRLGSSLLMAPAFAWVIYPRRSARDVMLGA